MSEISGYSCAKCGNVEYETDTISATGGFLSRMFDVQNKKFSAVTCTNCSYTEFYKADTRMLGNIFDLFAGG
jgi:uncharacterized protein